MQIIRAALQLLFVALLLLPCLAYGHTDDNWQRQESIGDVTEHLGARIPLDTVFRDESGKDVTLGALISGPTLILPVYYRCTNVCSVLQANIASALQKLQLKPATDYRVISISFDERETPELAARSRKTYLNAMRQSFPEEGWRFLTGDNSAIRRLTDSVGFNFQRRGADFAHPVVSIMVDKNGTIIRYLYGLTVLPKDLTLAVSEARSGISGASIRKMMDFCFTYDPNGRTYVFNLLRVSATTVLLCAGGLLAFLLFGGRRQRPSSGGKP